MVDVVGPPEYPGSVYDIPFSTESVPVVDVPSRVAYLDLIPRLLPRPLRSTSVPVVGPETYTYLLNSPVYGLTRYPGPVPVLNVPSTLCLLTFPPL